MICAPIKVFPLYWLLSPNDTKRQSVSLDLTFLHYYLIPFLRWWRLGFAVWCCRGRRYFDGRYQSKATDIQLFRYEFRILSWRIEVAHKTDLLCVVLFKDSILIVRGTWVSGMLAWSVFTGNLDCSAVQVGFGSSRLWIQRFTGKSETLAAFFNLWNKVSRVSVAFPT